MTVFVFLLERIFFNYNCWIRQCFTSKVWCFFLIRSVKKSQNAKTTEKLFWRFSSDFYTMQHFMQLVQHLYQINNHLIVFHKRVLIHLLITNPTNFKRRIHFLVWFFPDCCQKQPSTMRRNLFSFLISQIAFLLTLLILVRLPNIFREKFLSDEKKFSHIWQL